MLWLSVGKAPVSSFSIWKERRLTGNTAKCQIKSWKVIGCKIIQVLSERVQGRTCSVEGESCQTSSNWGKSQRKGGWLPPQEWSAKLGWVEWWALEKRVGESRRYCWLNRKWRPEAEGPHPGRRRIWEPVKSCQEREYELKRVTLQKWGKNDLSVKSREKRWGY